MFESQFSIQSRALFRLRDLCKRNDYRLTLKEIGRKFALCVTAHKQSREFKSFMRMGCPEDFANLEWNTLKTSVFDSELTQNKGRADFIPFVVREFIRLRP